MKSIVLVTPKLETLFQVILKKYCNTKKMNILKSSSQANRVTATVENCGVIHELVFMLTSKKPSDDELAMLGELYSQGFNVKHGFPVDDNIMCSIGLSAPLSNIK